jgi:NadR type nicotinamide-nucleotide adenylyltransferase
MPPKKVVVIGPESTGKSTLCRLLAERFHAPWVAEYARTFLLEHGMAYQLEDLLTIAKGQIQREDQQSQRGDLLFIDTDMYVMKVWSEFVFDRCDPWIIDQIALRTYDLYLLCDVDLPWVWDELREYPDPATREKLFRIYKDLLINQSTPWRVVSGSYDERLLIATQAVKDLMRTLEL